MKKFLTGLILLIIIISAWLFIDRLSYFSESTTPQQQEVVSESRLVEEKKSEDSEIIADNLEIPWEIAFLPSGELLVTERPGKLVKIGSDRTVIEVLGVRHVGEGGLLGLALHPNFPTNQLLY